MKKITNFIVDHRYVVFSFVLILTVICLFLAREVNINRDIIDYLPKNSDTKKGTSIMEDEFTGIDNGTLNIMFKGLKDDEKETILKKLTATPGVSKVTYENNADYNKDDYTLYVITSENPKEDKESEKLYKQIKEDYQGYTFYTSGDIEDEYKTILPLWIVALAIASALVILIIMCDSYIEPFLFLFAIGLGVFLNKGTNIFLGTISSITDSIAAILQLALSMDYSIMLMSRYRIEKEKEKDKVKAMKKALLDSFKAISSSSVTTIVGLLALVFMSFTIGRDLGIVLAKGVMFSLITIFTCLPALILMFDNLINKTTKRKPHIDLKFLGNFAYKARHLGIVFFLIVFLISYFLKNQLGILYTVSEIDEVGKVFKTNNQIAIVYENKYEDTITKYCKELENDQKIDDVLCYGNTINEKLTYDVMNKKLSDLGSDVNIDDYLLKILYYHYYNKDENNKVTFNDLITFIKNNVYQNDDLNKHVDDEMKKNIDKLEKFTTKEEMDKKRSSKDIQTLFEIDDDGMDKLITYYYSLKGNDKLTISEFITFMNDYLLKSEYAKELDGASKEKLAFVTPFTNKTTLNKNMTSKEMASLFQMNSDDVNNIYLYYLSLGEIDTKLSFNAFANVASNYSDTLDDGTKEKLAILESFSNKDIITTKIEAKDMAKLLGIDEQMISQVYSLHQLSTSSTDNPYTMSPYDFINYALTISLPSKDLEDNLNLLKLIMDSTINNITYTYQELAQALNLDEATVKNVYIMYTFQAKEVKMQPLTFVNFILKHQTDDVLKGKLDKETIANLETVQKIMENTLKDTKYSYKNIAKLLNIDENKMKLLFSLYQTSYKKKKISLSYREFVTFLIKDVMTNKDYQNQLTEDKKEKIKVIDEIMTSSLQNKKYLKDDLYRLTSKLSDNLDKDLIDLIYIYYGSEKEYDNASALTIEEFINFVNDDVLKDERFDDFIDKKMKDDVKDGVKLTHDAHQKLVGKNYSRALLNTTYAEENDETYAFIQKLDDDIGSIDGVYLVGNSPMGFEMSKTFQGELNFMTILTIIFIFVVVLVTFKSLIIPIILVGLIQTAVYLTMGINYLEGGSVYFIALLIVQSILMGATIDYAILYTSYYQEYRAKLDIKETIINAYNRSIHTILTSATILVLVTLIVGHFSAAITAKICMTISQGTLCSTILILLLLPELIATFDKFIVKHKHKKM